MVVATVAVTGGLGLVAIVAGVGDDAAAAGSSNVVVTVDAVIFSLVTITI